MSVLTSRWEKLYILKTIIFGWVIACVVAGMPLMQRTASNRFGRPCGHRPSLPKRANCFVKVGERTEQHQS